MYIANHAHGEMQIELCCKTQEKNQLIKNYLLIAMWLNYKELESLAGAFLKSEHSASLNPLSNPLMNDHRQMRSSPIRFTENQS